MPPPVVISTQRQIQVTATGGGPVQAPTADLDINSSSLAGWGTGYQNPNFHGDGMVYAQSLQDKDGRMIEWFDGQHGPSPGKPGPGYGIAGRYAQFAASGPPTLGLYAPIEGDTSYPTSSDNAPGFLLPWMPNGGWTDYYPLHCLGLDGTKVRQGSGSLYSTVDQMYKPTGLPTGQLLYNPATVTNPGTNTWQCFFGGSDGGSAGLRTVSRMYVIKSNPDYPGDSRPLWIHGISHGGWAPYVMRYAPQIGNWIYWGGCPQNIASYVPPGHDNFVLLSPKFWRIHVPSLLQNPPAFVQEACPDINLSGSEEYFPAIVADVPRRRIIHVGVAINVLQIPANDAVSGMQWHGPMYPTNASTWEVWKTIVCSPVSGYTSYRGMRAVHRSEFGPFGQTFIIGNASANFTRLKWNN